MKYLDVYKDCKMCPVIEYCGTMISSVRLCNSYEDSRKVYEGLSDEELRVINDELENNI